MKEESVRTAHLSILFGEGINFDDWKNAQKNIFHHIANVIKLFLGVLRIKVHFLLG